MTDSGLGVHFNVFWFIMTHDSLKMFTMDFNSFNPSQIEFIRKQTQCICSSYLHWTGKPLIEQADIASLFDASFAVISHDTGIDPVFNYANARAMELFKMNCEEFTILPSRYSAEPISRIERDTLLKRVAENGFVDDYQGIRVDKDGGRFLIRHATVWNLIGDAGEYAGQAALIKDWLPI